jgi:hypothetical protein
MKLLFSVAIVVLASGQAGAAVTYNGPGSGDDVPVATAVDNAGNVYVTAKSWGGPAAGFDIVTIKNSGDPFRGGWIARYNGSGACDVSGCSRLNDIPTAIAVDSVGFETDVYVTGFSNGTDITIRYSTRCLSRSLPVGVVACTYQLVSQDWVDSYTLSTDTSHFHPTAIAASAGHVYTTGYWDRAGYTSILTTGRDAQAGTHLWSKFYAPAGVDAA